MRTKGFGLLFKGNRLLQQKIQGGDPPPLCLTLSLLGVIQILLFFEASFLRYVRFLFCFVFWLFLFALKNYTSLIAGAAFYNLTGMELHFNVLEKFHVVNTISLTYGVLTSKTFLSLLAMENAMSCLLITYKTAHRATFCCPYASNVRMPRICFRANGCGWCLGLCHDVTDGITYQYFIYMIDRTWTPLFWL